MKIKKKVKIFLKWLNNKIRVFRIYNSEKKNIKRKKFLLKKINLNKKQIEDIDNLWIKNYGKKIPKDWHRLYTSYTGIFDKNYFPEIFFTTNLLDKLNPCNKKRVLADKILTSYFFKSIENEKYKVVINYIYNCNGYFYDDNRNNKI